MYKFGSIAFVIGLAAILNGQKLQGPMHDHVVVCYVATWAVYRPQEGSYPLDKLDPSLCTHLVYSFAGLDEGTDSIKSLDPWQDLTDNYGKGGYNKMVSLKGQYPHLKVTLAIGGWNEGSEKYSKMAADPARRARFISSVVSFLQRFGFDGLDLDWEYPAKRGGKPEDKANYVTLVRELKEAFEPHNMILTAALGAGKDTMDAAYDLPKLSKYLDLIHMMCYDYHGTWDGVVGANAPLYGMHDRDVLSIEYTIKYMLEHGVSPYKLVLGLPMYGRTFVLSEPSVKEVRFGLTAAQSKGFAGPFTKEAGFMGYNEICMELNNNTGDWERSWDEHSGTPYLRGKGAASRDRVISYDNPRSISMKVKMAIEHGLGGVMVWSIDTDDFRGACAPEEDALVDFRSRLDELKKSPVLDDVMHTLNLPDGSHHATLLKTNASLYIVDNGVLNLRPSARELDNYPLMRGINDAISAAVQEKRIMEEIEKKMKENEIEDEEKPKVGAGSVFKSSVLGVVMGVLVMLHR